MTDDSFCARGIWGCGHLSPAALPPSAILLSVFVDIKIIVYLLNLLTYLYKNIYVYIINIIIIYIE